MSKHSDTYGGKWMVYGCVWSIVKCTTTQWSLVWRRLRIEEQHKAAPRTDNSDDTIGCNQRSIREWFRKTDGFQAHSD